MSDIGLISGASVARLASSGCGCSGSCGSCGSAPVAAPSRPTSQESSRLAKDNEDVVELSDQAKKSIDSANATPETSDTTEAQNAKPADESKSAAPNELNEDEKKVVEELKRRDQEVRAHEQAHLAAAGGFASGGPSYSYQTGPDGKQYAIGGEVGIDTSPVEGDPDATIVKMQQIRAAALAPADPSAQDQLVAAEAAAAIRQAQAERSEQQPETAGAGQAEATEETGSSGDEHKVAGANGSASKEPKDNPTSPRVLGDLLDLFA